MATRRIESFEVVRISDGARFTPPYMEQDDYFGVTGILAGGLKKDGTPKAWTGNNRIKVVSEADSLTKEDQYAIFRSGQTSVYPGAAARIDEQRERTADGLRAYIAELKASLSAAQERLLDLYRVHGEKDGG